MKKFLKVFIAAALVFAMITALAGCFGEQTPAPKVDIGDLYGTWLYTKDNGEYVRYMFNDDNRYTVRSTINGNGLTGMGDYKLDGNKITLTPSEGTDKSTHEITKFDGNSMTWGSGSFAREYIKQ